MTLRPTLVVALVLSGAGLAFPTGFVDYLYIEANEGAASGGHAAIRFGSETYHFQHERPGVLRLRRDDSEQFRYAYGVLENRPMHVSRAAVPDETYSELRQRFSERYLIERTLFEERDALAHDRVLLERLVARRRGDATATIGLRGAGFFFPDDGESPSSAGLALLRRVQQTYGPDAVRQRIEYLRLELARVTPASADSPEIPAHGYPHFAYPFSSRYRDLLTALAALQALERALPLRADARWPSASAELELDPAERQVLAAFADRLMDQLTRLLRSDRPDWGYAFLVGMARLAALRETEQTGRLVLLDAFPPGSEVVPWSSVRQNRDVVPDLLAEAREDFARARTRLRSGAAIEERDYAEVEAAGNRLLELDAAVIGERELRVSAEPLLPSREAASADLVVPDVPDDRLARELERAKLTEKDFAARLERRYAYDLISRNCVSEIFETAGDGVGGHLGGKWSLDFIPFVSARAVNDRWNVVQRTTLSSFRRARLDEMYRRENRLHAWLRECNTLTSTIYRRNADDSFFLLFTDDVVAPRPLFGAVNVAGAVGVGAVGVALLPFDHGRTLMSGVRGALFSLPELAFINLRKGSFRYVPAADRPVESSSRPPLLDLARVDDECLPEPH